MTESKTVTTMQIKELNRRLDNCRWHLQQIFQEKVKLKEPAAVTAARKRVAEFEEKDRNARDAARYKAREQLNAVSDAIIRGRFEDALTLLTPIEKTVGTRNG